MRNSGTFDVAVLRSEERAEVLKHRDHPRVVDALPVAVWRLPALLRAKILNTDLILASFVDLSVLAERLGARGIQLEFGTEEWVVSRGPVEYRLSGPAAARARIDVAFGGLSLESMAERIDELLSLDSPDEPEPLMGYSSGLRESMRSRSSAVVG